MKVIYLHQYFNTPEMSGGTRSYEMARRMVSAGHEVHMVTSFRDSGSKKTGWHITKESGITVHWYSVEYSNHMGFCQRVKAFLAFALAAIKKASGIKGDIVFATSTPLTIAIPAVFVSRKQKIPMVFEVRDLWPELPIAVGALNNPLLRFSALKLEDWAYKNADAIVALSPGMKNGVIRTGYPENKIATIPNSSDNAEFSFNAEEAGVFRNKREWLADNPLLVYAGAFGKINDVGYLVKVARELLHIGSNVKILLIGEGVEKDKVIGEAKSFGVLGVNLFVEDKLPKCEIPALLNASTMASVLFADLPEMRSNSANKFFDALASGTPVFLNFGGWMHDLVRTYECGLAMWRCTIRDVAEELDKKMNNDEWVRKAGAASRSLAEEFFDRDLLCERLLSVLSATASGKQDQVSEIAPGNYS